MADFVRRVMRPERDDYPVRSLLGVDFYKFPMLYFIWTYYRGVEVRYECINRTKAVTVPLIVEEKTLRRALDYVRDLSFTESELTFLFGQEYYGNKMFPWEFIQFLRGLRLPPYELRIENDQYVLATQGAWEEVELWETIFLATVLELYARSLLARMTETELQVFYARAVERIWNKLLRIKQHPGIYFSDFGTRRRHSFLWQDFVVRMAMEMLGPQFLGTSEVSIASRRNIMPMGTNAHSLQMVLMALVFGTLYRAGDFSGIRASQYRMFEQWQDLFGHGLRIILGDTYGTKQFLDGAPAWLAYDWRGFRQDSGDPFIVGNTYLNWYASHGIANPRDAQKLGLFSDGLDVDPMIDLEAAFTPKITPGFGWGTMLTNGFDDLHPSPDKPVPGLAGVLWGDMKWAFSLVCKVTEANGNAAVKLSDNIEKATGPKDEIPRYLEVFGGDGRESLPVVV